MALSPPLVARAGSPSLTRLPGVAGVYTITATGVTDKSDTFSSTVAVTDLAGVTTYHTDQYRDGANTQEYALTPSTVTASTFGKLASCRVDGAIYAQPLWVPSSLGRAYAAEDDVARATLAFEGAYRIQSSAYVASLELANIEVKNRHYAKCVEYLQKALSIEKTDAVEDYLTRIKTLVSKDS